MQRKSKNSTPSTSVTPRKPVVKFQFPRLGHFSLRRIRTACSGIPDRSFRESAPAIVVPFLPFGNPFPHPIPVPLGSVFRCPEIPAHSRKSEQSGHPYGKGLFALPSTRVAYATGPPSVGKKGTFPAFQPLDKPGRFGYTQRVEMRQTAGIAAVGGTFQVSVSCGSIGS